MRTACDRALPGYSLYSFGSTTVFGLYEQKADFDFVLLSQDDIRLGRGQDPNTQQAKALQTHRLGALCKVIRQQNPSWKIEEVKRARVPVLRIKAPYASFDVTANRRNGVRNSYLLRGYFAQRPDARWIAVAVKQWSKKVGMNGGTGGFMTSYAFNILVAFWLLQRGMVEYVPVELTDVSKVPLVAPGIPIEQPKSVSEVGFMLDDFFNFYNNEFDFSKHVISLNRGKALVTKEELKWTLEMEDVLKMRSAEGERIAYRMCIEDPYEENLNLGRNVSQFRFDIFKQNMIRAQMTALEFLPLETPESKSSL
jgi:DNA polymerase sigma